MGFLSSVAGAVIGGAFDYLGVKDTNEANANQAEIANAMSHDQFWQAQRYNRNEAIIARNFTQRQNIASRRFLEKQSNTAIRRQMWDLRKAGLNPILAARYSGANASAASMIGGPNAASVQGRTGVMANMQNALGAGVRTGLDVYSTMNEVERTVEATGKIRQEVENLEATKNLTEEQTEQVVNLIQEIQARTAKLRAEEPNVKADTRLKNEQTKIQDHINTTTEVVHEVLTRVDAAATAGAAVDQALGGAQKIGEAVREFFEKRFQSIKKLFNEHSTGGGF